MKNYKFHWLAIWTALAMTACGGGGGGSDSENSVVQLDGSVIDGYVQGARVYLDKNHNGVFDEDSEPSAVTDANGSFQLDLTDADIEAVKSAPIRAYLGEGAVDLSTGEDFSVNTVTFSCPPLFILDAQQLEATRITLSPFTTLVFNEMELDLTLENLTPEQLSLVEKATRMKVLGSLHLEDAITPDQVFGDFIASVQDPDQRETLSQLAITTTDMLQKQAELQAKAAPGETVKVKMRKYDFIEWHTGELLHLVEEQIITRWTDVDVDVETNKITKHFATENYEIEMDASGNPLEYEVVTVTRHTNDDGTYTELARYNIDKNKDGVKGFWGQAFITGVIESTASGSVDTSLVYFDEGRLFDDDPSVPNAGSFYDDVDLAKNLTQETPDLTGVDMVQYKTLTRTISTTSDRLKLAFGSVYDLSDLDTPIYRETRVDEYFLNGTQTHSVAKDWKADGSINEYTENTRTADGTTKSKHHRPVWAWNGLENPVWEEYANFNFEVPEQTSNYFFKQESMTSTDGNGVKTTTENGERHILSDANDAAVATDGSPLIFHTYLTVRTTDAADTETQEFVEWLHEALPGYDFTADNMGQKIGLWEKASDGEQLWRGYDFSEYGSQDLDLHEKRDEILDTGKAFEAISDADVKGFSAYAELRLGGGFFTNEDGSRRTWYIVRKDDATGAWVMTEEDWRDTSFNFQFHNFVGMLHAYVPYGYEVDHDWHNDTDVLTWIPVHSFDNKDGVVEALIGGNEEKPLYIHLNQESAQARLEHEQNATTQ